MNTVKIGIIITFCALSIGTDYALVGVTNVKPMDLIVFIGGFLFGPVVGSSIGVLSWSIYGALNPLGFEPRIWLVTMFAESVYGITGGLLGRALGTRGLSTQRLRLIVLFAAMGFLPTVLYDLVTNVVYASVFNIPIITAIFMGAPFAVLHEVANFIMFGVLSVPTIVALGKVVNGWQIRPA
jgi:hypothetical protein